MACGVAQILVALDHEWYKKPYSQVTIPWKWVNEVLANVLRKFNGAAQLLNE
jgi:hypothetical protein